MMLPSICGANAGNSLDEKDLQEGCNAEGRVGPAGTEESLPVTYRRGSGTRIGRVLPSGSVYAMVSRGESCFQKHMLHCAPPLDGTLQRIMSRHGIPPTPCGVPRARLSLTLRWSGTRQATSGVVDQLPMAWVSENPQLGVAYFTSSKIPSFKEVFEIVKPFLCADVTKMFGKTMANHGRSVATFALEGGPSVYKYSGKRVAVVGLPKGLEGMVDLISSRTGCSFNMVHCTYYPDDVCKLDWHADDEKTIAQYSTIAGVSLYEDQRHCRSVEFMQRPAPLKRKVPDSAPAK